MKDWKCPVCHREKVTADNVKMVVCYCCQVKMEGIEDEMSEM
jgi:ribosomal protein L37AE/L43A